MDTETGAAIVALSEAMMAGFARNNHQVRAEIAALTVRVERLAQCQSDRG